MLIFASAKRLFTSAYTKQDLLLLVNAHNNGKNKKWGENAYKQLIMHHLLLVIKNNEWRSHSIFTANGIFKNLISALIFASLFCFLLNFNVINF